MKFAFESGEKVIFIGDSITDCGRRADPLMLGSGYVKIFKDLVLANMPELDIEIINKGIGGNTLIDLENRWTEDVINHNPDWLSVLIGINDIHAVLRKTEYGEECVPERYYERYGKILKTAVEKTGCRIILIEPFFISTDKTDAFKGMVLNILEEYISAVVKLSVEYKTVLLETQSVFQKHLKYRNTEVFCPEPVHPNQTGHFIIAQSLFNLLKK